MDPIQSLKQRATDKRDKAIKAAQAEYRVTLRQLKELAASLPASSQLAPEPRTRRRRNQTITKLVLELMPKDQAFTSRDMLGLLEHTEPGRPFNEPTVRTIFHRLMQQGLLQKVRKGGRGCIFWAAAECPITDYGPFAAMSVRDIIATVLKEQGPMRPVEAVLAIQGRGYRPDADKRILLQMVSQAFKRNRDRFACGDDGRWSSV